MQAAIIIGTYNNEEHISDAIRSVKSQTHKNWEALIIDNGSTDSTSIIARREISGDSRFRFIQKENEGPSSCRNLGFKEAGDSNEFIHFLDGDDLLYANFLHVMCNYLSENVNVGVVGCQFDNIDESGNFVSHGNRSRFAKGFLGFPKKLGSDEYNTPFECFFAATGQGPFAVFRCETFSHTKGYEPTFWTHEDSDIFCQMALISEVHYLPNRLYKKRFLKNSLTYSSVSNYSKFRKKWDTFASEDFKINNSIRAAVRYYYGFHAPLRDFKVASNALKEFCIERNFNNLQWSLKCFMSGINNLIFRHNVTRKLRRLNKIHDSYG